jgi:hypothetical protein
MRAVIVPRWHGNRLVGDKAPDFNERAVARGR